MRFINYQHIERLSNGECDGILNGTCYIFPKIDGTQSQIRCDDNGLHFCSHHRELSLESDNAKFMETCISDVSLCAKLHQFFDLYPNTIIFGEWLVPHTLKTYRDDCWRKLYIFDVCRINDDSSLTYIPFDTYSEMLDKVQLEYIPYLKVIDNPTEEQLSECLESNDYLIKENSGVGEGIVIKNYDFRNRRGDCQYAKIVRQEFREKHSRIKAEEKENTTETCIEQKILDEFLTRAYCEKEFAKIKLDIENSGKTYSNKDIPRVLNTIWHTLIKEESWNIIKKFKNPVIDFHKLQTLCFNQIKTLIPEIIC